MDPIPGHTYVCTRLVCCPWLPGDLAEPTAQKAQSPVAPINAGCPKLRHTHILRAQSVQCCGFISSCWPGGPWTVSAARLSVASEGICLLVPTSSHNPFHLQARWPVRQDPGKQFENCRRARKGEV